MQYSLLQKEEQKGSIPPPRINGGLYTGEPALGPWGAVPVTPDATVYLTQNLRSAQPPPGAIEQPAGFVRPGNSHIDHPFHIPVANLSLTAIRDGEPREWNVVPAGALGVTMGPRFGAR